MSPEIKGGYILQPRKVDSSELIHCPPVVRELWFYLLRKVNWQDNGVYKRGEGFFRFEDIQNDLCWYVGYRKMMYSKPQLTKSLRRLREGNAIATTKETRGIRVTIVNYGFYQDRKNYERNDEEITKEERRKEDGSTILKEEYKEEKEKNTPPTPRKRGAKAELSLEELVSEGMPLELASDLLAHRKGKRAPLTRTAWAGIVREAGVAGVSVPEAVRYMIERGWQSYRAGWAVDQKPAVATPESSEKCGDCDLFKDCHRKPRPDQSACGRFETDPALQLQRIQARGTR